MECLQNQNLESCIDYCGLLVKTTKYTTINNLWECIDQYAKIPPRIYGEAKCNSLDRFNQTRNKKECYDAINVDVSNDFEGIYDAKRSYCKWQMINAPYAEWELCNDLWKVKYDE